MKEKFKYKFTFLKSRGVTLLELLITISLMGLIFVLGMYPMLTQIRLTRAERTEIALFDDANLAVYYITRDAMKAEKADDTTLNEITFTITTDHTTSPRTTKTVRYYVINGTTELERNDSDEGQRIITNKIDGVAVNGNPVNLPTFAIDPAALHRLECTIHLQDLDDPNMATRRDFEVMLRCRDARL